jgi:hypothetical protein
MSYKPDPIDTSSVKLTPEILELTERLARNAHETWARQRLGEGWSYGPQRDDRRKEHPCLVSYGELPDSEKTYDRQTAMETVKMLLALGYTIERPGAGAAVSTSGARLIDATRALAKLGSAPLNDLIKVWVGRDSVWSSSAENFSALGERLLHTGDPLFAYDVVSEGLKHFPSHTRLRQLLGLSLARAHATEAANRVLHALFDEGYRDEETVGLLARTFKDLAAQSPDEAERRLHLRKAFELYTASYRSHGSYWTGINAATMALLCGEDYQAADLARGVRDLCMRQLSFASHGED